jgi:hypothetical protein
VCWSTCFIISLDDVTSYPDVLLRLIAGSEKEDFSWMKTFHGFHSTVLIARAKSCSEMMRHLVNQLTPNMRYRPKGLIYRKRETFVTFVLYEENEVSVCSTHKTAVLTTVNFIAAYR